MQYKRTMWIFQSPLSDEAIVKNKLRTHTVKREGKLEKNGIFITMNEVTISVLTENLVHAQKALPAKQFTINANI